MSNNKPGKEKREMEWPGAPKKTKKSGEMEWPKPGNLIETDVEAIVRDLDKNAKILELWNLFDHF